MYPKTINVIVRIERRIIIINFFLDFFNFFISMIVSASRNIAIHINIILFTIVIIAKLKMIVKLFFQAVS